MSVCVCRTQIYNLHCETNFGSLSHNNAPNCCFTCINVQCMVNLKKPLWQVKRRENTVVVSVWVYHSIHVHDACLSWIFTMFGVFGNFRLNEKQAKQEWDKNRTTKPNNRHTNIELLNAFGMICGKFCCCFERCKLKKKSIEISSKWRFACQNRCDFVWLVWILCVFIR